MPKKRRGSTPDEDLNKRRARAEFFDMRYFDQFINHSSSDSEGEVEADQNSTGANGDNVQGVAIGNATSAPISSDNSQVQHQTLGAKTPILTYANTPDSSIPPLGSGDSDVPSNSDSMASSDDKNSREGGDEMDIDCDGEGYEVGAPNAPSSSVSSTSNSARRLSCSLEKLGL